MRHLAMIASLVLFCAAPFTATAVTSTVDVRDAEATVIRYLDALAQGDTVTIRSLLTGRLLEAREPLLSNPTYPSHLINTFQGARFELSGHTVLNNDTVAVDANIIFKPGDVLTRRFLLRLEPGTSTSVARYYIFDETDATTPLD